MKKSLVGYAYNDPDEGYKITCLVSADQLELPFYFCTFGRSFRETNIFWQGQDKCFLVYSEKGCGRVFINGRWEEFPEGSLAYFPSKAPVQYEPISTEPWQVVFITYAGRNAESALGVNECLIKSAELTFISQLLDQLTDKHDKPDWQEFSGGVLYYLLLRLRRLAGGSAANDNKTTVSQRMKQSVKYIIEHFSDDLAVSHLAEECGISEEYYCRLFKKLTGASPVNYINSLRIAKACDLLLKLPNMKIEEIGLECGFRNITYFNKLFKRETGVSPSEFRNQNKKET